MVKLWVTQIKEGREGFVQEEERGMFFKASAWFANCGYHGAVVGSAPDQ